ncbi:hypothetical protein CYMTET_45196, partial [Cymbomonas tetramitiformis]
MAASSNQGFDETLQQCTSLSVQVNLDIYGEPGGAAIFAQIQGPDVEENLVSERENLALSESTTTPRAEIQERSAPTKSLLESRRKSENHPLPVLNAMLRRSPGRSSDQLQTQRPEHPQERGMNSNMREHAPDFPLGLLPGCVFGRVEDNTLSDEMQVFCLTVADQITVYDHKIATFKKQNMQLQMQRDILQNMLLKQQVQTTFEAVKATQKSYPQRDIDPSVGINSTDLQGACLPWNDATAQRDPRMASSPQDIQLDNKITYSISQNIMARNMQDPSESVKAEIEVHLSSGLTSNVDGGEHALELQKALREREYELKMLQAETWQLEKEMQAARQMCKSLEPNTSDELEVYNVRASEWESSTKDELTTCCKEVHETEVETEVKAAHRAVEELRARLGEGGLSEEEAAPLRAQLGHAQRRASSLSSALEEAGSAPASALGVARRVLGPEVEAAHRAVEELRARLGEGGL